MLPREDIAATLFALTDPLGQFKTRSRRIIPIAQVTAAQMPALFQMQDDESVIKDQRTLAGMYASMMRFYWIIYASSPQDQKTAPSSILNPLVDAVLATLPPSNVPFVVDGVACPLAWDAGKVNYIEGIVVGTSVAEIPVVISVPWATQ